VRGKVSRHVLGQFQTGVELEEGVTAPADARLLKQSAKTALVEVVLHEGRKRQVRRMFAAMGLPVEELHRRRYGPLTDKNLKVGDFRELSGDEVDALRRAGEHSVEAVQAEPEEQAVTLAATAEDDSQETAGDTVATAGSPPVAGPAARARAVEAPSEEAVAAPPATSDAGAGATPDQPSGPEDRRR
jgi:hypothetical protein